MADAKRALDIANDRYVGGVTNYLDVITAQTTLLSNQRLQAQLLGQQMEQFGPARQSAWRRLGCQRDQLTSKYIRMQGRSSSSRLGVFERSVAVSAARCGGVSVPPNPYIKGQKHGRQSRAGDRCQWRSWKSVTKALLDAGFSVVGLSPKIDVSDFDHPHFTALPASLNSLDAAKKAVETVMAHFGKIDVLAHLVGAFAGGSTVAETDDATFQRMFDVNSTVPFIFSRSNPEMRKAKEGRIIAIGSRAGRRTLDLGGRL